jgi:hypothetical protein
MHLLVHPQLHPTTKLCKVRQATAITQVSDTMIQNTNANIDVLYNALDAQKERKKERNPNSIFT